MPPKRMTANPVKAPRYRPGKAVPEEASDSEESEADVPSPPQQKQQQQASKPPPKYASAAGISSNLRDLDLDKRRKQAAEKEEKRVAAEKAAKAKEEEGFVTEEESEEESEEEESEDEESEEESEEELPRRVMMRPTFVKKDKRQTTAVAQDTKPEEERLAEEEERKKAAADELVEEQIRKDVAAKAAGKKGWDDDDEVEEDVDDTDGLDPEAEHAAWKLRELIRIKRDREAIEAREKELEEIERRRNLTEEERKAEDEEFLQKQQEEKDGKGKMGYMQKYHHKGAFFQDDLKETNLDRRDIMGSRFADDVQNRELLPQALQMRDMTKLGKKGATKYRDLKSEDTGQWGVFDDKKPRRHNVPLGVDERFMPDDRGRSGANDLPLGPRRPAAVDGRDEKSRESYRPRSRSPRRDRQEQSRSRYPRRDRDQDEQGRRKRESSRDGGRYEYDKRRRVD